MISFHILGCNPSHTLLFHRLPQHLMQLPMHAWKLFSFALLYTISHFSLRWRLCCGPSGSHGRCFCHHNQQRMHAGDSANPSSDIAAQLAAGMGILAKWMEMSQYTSVEDKTILVPRMVDRARNAYAYAKEMFARSTTSFADGGTDTTCSGSAARKNCIGVACATDTSLSVCSSSFTVLHIPPAPVALPTCNGSRTGQ